jgi:hypothetical protein
MTDVIQFKNNGLGVSLLNLGYPACRFGAAGKPSWIPAHYAMGVMSGMTGTCGWGFRFQVSDFLCELCGSA